MFVWPSYVGVVLKVSQVKQDYDKLQRRYLHRHGHDKNRHSSDESEIKQITAELEVQKSATSCAIWESQFCLLSDKGDVLVKTPTEAGES